MNIRKHRPSDRQALDPCSTARWFDGFLPQRAPTTGRDPPPVSPPRTWLASHGWRRLGLIDPREAPRSPT